jgi:hypothetical protein
MICAKATIDDLDFITNSTIILVLTADAETLPENAFYLL